jgi:hypothetical protein
MVSFTPQPLIPQGKKELPVSIAYEIMWAFGTMTGGFLLGGKAARA